MSNSPYLSIWFKTKETIDNILSGKTKFNYHIPILLSAISGSENVIIDSNALLGDPILAIILGIIFIVIGYLLLSRLLPWLIKQVGKIWNGDGNIHELKIVVGLSQIPVLIIIFEQLLFLLFGELKASWEINIAIQWVVWIFTMCILILGIARTQGFSYGITILNFFLIVLPIIVIQLMILN